MRAGDLLTLLPLLVLAGAAVLCMLLTAAWKSHAVALSVTLAGLAGAAASLAVVAGRGERQVTALVLLDDYALFLIGLIVAAGAAVAVMSAGYLRRSPEPPLDYYSVLLIATLGAVTLAVAMHFASVFLGLELLSVALYVLIAYPRRRAVAVEAGIKYLILAGTTAAALLFGMALVYAVSGRMDLAGLTAPRAGGSAGDDVIFIAGLALILVGVGFKLALVPFHMWTPDVYQGAPAPVAAFVATVSKAAVVALLLRLARAAQLPAGAALEIVLSVLAIASMLVGNLLALLQRDVKRILAYSSIAHLGYLMVPFVAGGRAAAVAVLFYLVAYVVTMLGAFGVVTALSSPEHEADDLEDYAGLGRRRPLLAAAFTLVLLSLAGIPLTAGFVGKFYLVTAGARASLWALLVILALTSAMSVFYYTRIIVAMYVREPEGDGAQGGLPLGVHGGLPLGVHGHMPQPATVGLLGLLLVALLVLGTYPAPLLRLIDLTVRPLP